MQVFQGRFINCLWQGFNRLSRSCVSRIHALSFRQTRCGNSVVRAEKKHVLSARRPNTNSASAYYIFCLHTAFSDSYSTFVRDRVPTMLEGNQAIAPRNFQKHILSRGGSRWAVGAIAPPKAYESNIIHHNFVQFGKQHSRYKTIL